jgi:putative FmdB family regulatory protein
MPLYTFYCQTCKKDFNAFLRLSEAKKGAPCPSCGGKAVDRSQGSAIMQNQPTIMPAGAGCSLPQSD